MTKEMKIVTMTPAMAAQILEKNPENRELRQNRVDELAKAMARGDFLFNGDAIRIREDGLLADGQHRLWACVQSGVSFKTALFSGLTMDDMLTIDIGRRRSAGDSLKIKRKVANASAHAAAIRSLAVYSRGVAKTSLTLTEIDRIFDHTPEIEKSIATCWVSRRGALPIRLGMFYAIHYIGSVIQKKPDLADEFIEVLLTGVPAYTNCAAHRLRDLFLRDRGSASKSLREDAKYAYVAAAWLKFADRAEVKLLKPMEPFKIESIPLDKWLEA